MNTDSSTVAALNDAFRCGGGNGRLYVTAGLAGRADLGEIIHKVATFDRFDQSNDPYGEHDFGSFEHHGETLYWKIDCYDSEMRMGSPDPSDPSVTSRVLTVMLASEY